MEHKPAESFRLFARSIRAHWSWLGEARRPHCAGEGLQHSLHDMNHRVRRIGSDTALEGQTDLSEAYCFWTCCLRDCDRRGVAAWWFRCPSDAQFGRTAPSHTKRCARHRLQVAHVFSQRTLTDTRKALDEPSVVAVARQALVITKVLGESDSSVTMTVHADSLEHLRHDYVDHPMVHYPRD